MLRFFVSGPSLCVPRWKTPVSGSVQLLCVALLLADCQNDVPTKAIDAEISGVVIEAGTVIPVPEARVSLIRLPTKGPVVVSISTPKEVVQTTSTDLGGSFVFVV